MITRIPPTTRLDTTKLDHLLLVIGNNVSQVLVGIADEITEQGNDE